MNKLFISIDGVLSNKAHMEAKWEKRKNGDYSVFIMPEKVEILNKIRTALPGFDLVIHSHWAKSLGKDATRNALERHGITPVEFTPKKLTSDKIHEIQFALQDEAGPHRVVVLDSTDFGSDYLKERYGNVLFIKTDRAVGLTEQHLQEVIEWSK